MAKDEGKWEEKETCMTNIQYLDMEMKLGWRIPRSVGISVNRSSNAEN